MFTVKLKLKIGKIRIGGTNKGNQQIPSTFFWGILWQTLIHKLSCEVSDIGS